MLVVAATAFAAVSVTMSAMTSAMSVLMIAVTLTVAMTASAATSTSATAAASFTAQTVHHALYLLVGCLAALHDLAFEVELHACKRMVEVHCHSVVGHLEHVSEEAVAILILQWYDSILVYIVVVEVSVYAEHALIQIQHAGLLKFAVSLFLRQNEVERRTLLERIYLIFELVERYSEACYKLKRFLLGSFLHKFGVTVGSGIQLISDGHIFVYFLVHLSVLFLIMLAKLIILIHSAYQGVTQFIIHILVYIEYFALFCKDKNTES